MASTAFIAAYPQGLWPCQGTSPHRLCWKGWSKWRGNQRSSRILVTLLTLCLTMATAAPLRQQHWGLRATGPHTWSAILSGTSHTTTATGSNQLCSRQTTTTITDHLTTTITATSTDPSQHQKPFATTLTIRLWFPFDLQNVQNQALLELSEHQTMRCAKGATALKPLWECFLSSSFFCFFFS